MWQPYYPIICLRHKRTDHPQTKIISNFSQHPPTNDFTIIATHIPSIRPSQPQSWVAYEQKPSRSPPRSSSSDTTPSSPSISRPTSASAMKLPSLLPSVSATRFVEHYKGWREWLLIYLTIDCWLHHTFDEAYSARSSPWYLLQVARRGA